MPSPRLPDYLTEARKVMPQQQSGEGLRGQIKADLYEVLQEWALRQEDLLRWMVAEQRRLREDLTHSSVEENGLGAFYGDRSRNKSADLWQGDLLPLSVDLNEEEIVLKVKPIGNSHKDTSFEMKKDIPPAVVKSEFAISPDQMPTSSPQSNSNGEAKECGNEEKTEGLRVRMSSNQRVHHTLLGRFVTSTFFHVCITVTILVNAVYMGIVAQLEIDEVYMHLETGRSISTVSSKGLEIVFVLVYVAEIVLKLIYFKWDFFLDSKDRGWNVFDLLLVVAAVLDYVQFGGGGARFSWIRVLNVFKQVLKALRIVRVVKMFREVRILMMSIAASIYSFFWAMVTLLILMYVYSIVFVNGLAQYLLERIHDGHLNEDFIGKASQHWGSIAKAMLTEYKSITGGQPWYGAFNVLEELGFFYAFFFLLYISVFCLAILRILTGIFVSQVKSSMDRDHEQTVAQNLKSLFERMDTDGSGNITKEEFAACLQEQKADEYLRMLNIVPQDANKLFRMLDSSGDGFIELDEFIRGCQKFGGWAKNIDMSVSMCRMNEIKMMIEMMAAYLDERIYNVYSEAKKTDDVGDRSRATNCDGKVGNGQAMSIPPQEELISKDLALKAVIDIYGVDKKEPLRRRFERLKTDSKLRRQMSNMA